MSPHTDAEIKRWAHKRRPHEREAVPAIGERLLLREADFGETVPCAVFAVQEMGAAGSHWRQHGDRVAAEGPGVPDPTVWVPGEHGWEWHPDPWPWVHVQVITTGDDGREILSAPRWCKEARVRGSAGWMREGSRAHTGNYESEG